MKRKGRKKECEVEDQEMMGINAGDSQNRGAGRCGRHKLQNASAIASRQ
jgi:hypothetical protein